jgi:AraC-like DNA-binding protein
VRETGSGLRDHIAALRVAHAIERLTTGSSQIKQIALEGGYRSVSQMDRDFQRCVGMRPKEVREAITNGEDVSEVLWRVVGASDSDVSGSERIVCRHAARRPCSRPPHLLRSSRSARR